MKNHLEDSYQPAFNPSAYNPNAPPPYPYSNQQMPQPQPSVTMSTQPQPGFHQQPAAQAQYTLAPFHLGESSVRMVCPNCRKEIMTNVATECSTKQHIIALIMCLSGMLTLCSCLPYCCNDCSLYKHSCPSCRMHIGSYSP
ncbi:lipopolysaccharide-induced tumor necrosis factor-alpha factor homolog [Planococcus citri]|uniref:lipopolysaccharide-induced tumor necrosis factor-alpha factor homolog n=1 Tax=Planococcus citri TaxID=170843 RepID=UPI0031F9CEFC